ncbi:hypothetical protein [Cloacibacillus sp. An23]|uniref:hypothetical protein n=1 Tax=Cloacibacillus sp. An23 TaxID=1965591 RepID=UPI000B367436|nr:hypothetical protein [Cloacibacillus sp. An23]OUO94755.1 hypothetical protein B5F39_02490 [Cloacibacillus sp. An23]
MSLYEQYRTVYLDGEQALKQFGKDHAAGFYVYHITKDTAGPYQTREGALRYIEEEIFKETYPELAAEENKDR